MNNDKLITLLGIIFISLWLSNVPYLFPVPFQPHQGIKDLSKEVADAPEFIKEQAGVGGKTQTEIETIVMRDLRILWIKSLVFIIIGIFSGILIVQKKNLGRFLALGLSLYLVGIRFYHFFSSEYWREKFSIKYFTVRFHFFPVRTVHEEVTFLILLGVIALLLMPSIARGFKTKRMNKVAIRQANQGDGDRPVAFFGGYCPRAFFLPLGSQK
jgi:hypothetical protein